MRQKISQDELNSFSTPPNNKIRTAKNVPVNNRVGTDITKKFETRAFEVRHLREIEPRLYDDKNTKNQTQENT